jgi:hypothetical protein
LCEAKLRQSPYDSSRRCVGKTLSAWSYLTRLIQLLSEVLDAKISCRLKRCDSRLKLTYRGVERAAASGSDRSLLLGSMNYNGHRAIHLQLAAIHLDVLRRGHSRAFLAQGHEMGTQGAAKCAPTITDLDNGQLPRFSQIE